MFDSVIRLEARNNDLTRRDEYWECCSFNDRKKVLVEHIVKIRREYPYKTVIFCKEGVFSIAPTTTMDDLRHLSTVIEKSFNIPCIQISIDRDRQEAHMLFDVINRADGLLTRIDRSKQIVLGVLILRVLRLPRPAGTELWMRYFLKDAYSDDRQVFVKAREKVLKTPLSADTQRLLLDVLSYAEQVCEGLVK